MIAVVVVKVVAIAAAPLAGKKKNCQTEPNRIYSAPSSSFFLSLFSLALRMRCFFFSSRIQPCYKFYILYFAFTQITHTYADLGESWISISRFENWSNGFQGIGTSTPVPDEDIWIEVARGKTYNNNNHSIRAKQSKYIGVGRFSRLCLLPLQLLTTLTLNGSAR